MRYFLCFVFTACSLFSEIPLLKRDTPVPLTTSLIVPCIPKHFQYIPELLEQYAKQTVPPDEIVISLSEAASMASGEIDAVKNNPWPFQLKIIEHKEKRSEGENRNLGTQYASGDLMLYQDADDLPHPQRVELIKRLFENYQIDHLLHAYVLDTDFRGFTIYDFDSLPVYYSKELTNCVGNRHLHNGATALTRDVAHRVKWVEGFKISTDTFTNQEIYKVVNQKVFLLEPLVLYRHTFSTYHGINQ
jgi:glycosyltransferase involved in cell wall biosynthesis